MQIIKTSIETRRLVVQLGVHTLQVRALKDLQQGVLEADAAPDAIVSSAQWSLFGQLWPSGKALAQCMSDRVLARPRILEFGCGLGLPSLLLQARGMDVTASDIHPEAQAFLKFNTDLNGLAEIPFITAAFTEMPAGCGRFDLLIGADVLYERGSADAVADLIHAHALPLAEVVLADPGRRLTARFMRLMGLLGFSAVESRGAFEPSAGPSRDRMLSFKRPH